MCLTVLQRWKELDTLVVADVLLWKRWLQYVVLVEVLKCVAYFNTIIHNEQLKKMQEKIAFNMLQKCFIFMHMKSEI